MSWIDLGATEAAVLQAAVEGLTFDAIFAYVAPVNGTCADGKQPRQTIDQRPGSTRWRLHACVFARAGKGGGAKRPGIMPSTHHHLVRCKQ